MHDGVLLHVEPEQLVHAEFEELQITPMVMEKQKDTIARYRGESSNFTRSDRLSRSTSEKPIAAARKPFIVCNTVSRTGRSHRTN